MLFLSVIKRQFSFSKMAKIHFYVFSLIVLIYASKDANAVHGNQDFDNYKILYPHKPLNLVCNVTESMSGASVTWTKGDQKVVSSERVTLKPNGELVISKALESDADNYTCTVTYTLSNGTETYPIKEEYIVIVRPSVWMPKTKNIVEGESLELNCSVTGIPPPTVFWEIGNLTLTESTDHIVLKEDRGVPNAILYIKETVLADRGTYKCNATNRANTTSTETFVRVKDKLAALWPFLGICAEVFVLCTIILIYEKRRNKAELEESDTDQSPEQKNTPDMGKDADVRHRK